MATTPPHKTPSYASYTSFTNFEGHLAGMPLPSRIDKSVMAHLNYGTRQALMAALRSLSLIDDNDAPTERLERLIAADKEQRRAILLDAAREAYPYLFDGSIDLSRTTTDEFHTAIREATGASGTTIDKASSFFFGLAADAGIELSPHLTSRKAGASGGGAKRAKPRAKKHKAAARAEAGGDEGETKTRKSGTMAESLLAKFPDMNPDWSPDLQAKWFSAFEKLMKSAEKAGQI